ncbi:polyphosphate glucokinase [Roseivirga seohaensis]|uniref:Polyphosphate glucokinase n=1 Tax=Roseivirga seohaensis TaxID=1914963 RepID=A0A150Y2K6_9BACT|nr:ROK family protein [Roseivirga seohaensis]KYG85227.1 polyphosphate glucokinase [Roseivirga seohaensis]
MQVLGIDIGGTGIKGAIVDTITGQMVSERYRLDTPQPSTPEALAKTVKKLIDHFEWKGNVGCAFPTVVIKGKAIYSSNLDDSWVGTQIDETFSKYCDGLKFTVINDADAAGIAEMRFGAGKGLDGLVITITIGTGLGSGVFYNGQLIPNFELGRIYGIDGNVIEHYAAGSAKTREDLSFKEYGKRFNFFLKHIERICSPDHIIIGGGLSKKIHKIEKHIKINTPYSVSAKLNNSGIVGAAMYAAEKG